MSERDTKRGRPPFGREPAPKVVPFSTSLPPELYDRLEKYCADEERAKAWVITKAVDLWLTGKGY